MLFPVLSAHIFCLRSLILLCPLVISPSQPDFLAEERQLLTSSLEIDVTLISEG